jgi:hypothetical protein
MKHPEADRESKAAHAERNRGAIVAARKVAYAANRTEAIAAARAWARANPDRQHKAQRKSHLKRMFGITVEQFDAMLASQDGRCAICDTNDPGQRHFHVDHDHATNVVRGLLCGNCNKALGLMREDPARLLAAERYLQSHRSPAPGYPPSGVGGHLARAG